MKKGFGVGIAILALGAVVTGCGQAPTTSNTTANTVKTTQTVSKVQPRVEVVGLRTKNTFNVLFSGGKVQKEIPYPAMIFNFPDTSPLLHKIYPTLVPKLEKQPSYSQTQVLMGGQTSVAILESPEAVGLLDSATVPMAETVVLDKNSPIQVGKYDMGSCFYPVDSGLFPASKAQLKTVAKTQEYNGAKVYQGNGYVTIIHFPAKS